MPTSPEPFEVKVTSPEYPKVGRNGVGDLIAQIVGSAASLEPRASLNPWTRRIQITSEA